jgi:2-polyprenyl-3-methyl-5-hydroxy-6-metoxy-1,4-benzoquinol methylase
VSVLAIDENVRAVADIAAVAAGGVTRLAASVMDARRVALGAASVDVVTILEVLEHLEEPERAAREAVRVARGFVVASVPSVPDENPEHLRLYDRRSLERLLLEAGARKVSIEYVLNHMIAVARV